MNNVIFEGFVSEQRTTPVSLKQRQIYFTAAF